MKRMLVSVSLVLAAVLASAAASAGAPPRDAKEARKVDYPAGYRDWTHVKSMVLQDGHPLFQAFGGIHHVYANEKALKGLQGGKHAFPDGSVLVFDLLEAPSANGAVTEGARKVVGVMQKDSKDWAATGGWGFEGFKGDTKERVVKDASESCFTCHKAQAASSDYVFTTWRN